MIEEDLTTVQSLAELEKIVKECEHCPLRRTRTNLVFGVGNPDADLMFIGEAPGFHEDRLGEPFVGAAGKLLDELIHSFLGLTRKDVYIGNVLKCRPPENRDPLPEEIEHCKPFLMKQIELINPKVICTLGNFSTKLILNKNVNISKVHGQSFAEGGRWVFPTYHPAAALYTNATRSALEEDFKKLAELLKKEAPEPERQTEQLGLF